MVRITFVAHDGSERGVEAAGGTTLMEAAKAHDVPGIEAVCGGNCYCGTCRVRVADAWLARLTPPEGFERDLIEATAGDEAGQDPRSRLSCQITLDESLDGLIVHTPDAQC